MLGKQERKRKHKMRVTAPDSAPGDEEVLNFSFKYFDETDRNFPTAQCDKDFMHALLEKMRYYSEMSVKKFTQEDFKEKRHTLTWPLRGYDGFPVDNNEIGADQSWQFCLNDLRGNTHHKWRVHGFLMGNTFYIVWFDPNHFLTIEGKTR